MSLQMKNVQDVGLHLFILYEIMLLY